MAFDGLVLAAVRQELEQRLLGGRINKIYQPEKEEVVLHVRSLGQNEKLVLSAHAQKARVQLTRLQKENPQSPPMFCMILRKHLEGGKIIAIEQPGLERVLRITVEAPDELGMVSRKVLIAEIMGKHSNIILLNPLDNTILDGIKRYTHATSRYREVLPGREYLAPPSQDKISPFDLDSEELGQLLLSAPEGSRVAKVLLKHLDGLSPESCREVLLQSGLPEEQLTDHCGRYEVDKINSFLQKLGTMVVQGGLTPSLVRDQTGQVRAFSALDLQSYYPLPKEHGTMNSVLDTYFTELQSTSGLEQQKNRLEQVVDGELARLTKKLAIYRESLDEVEVGERYRLYGELLTSNMYQLQKGLDRLKVINYYDPEGGEVEIPLDIQSTPSQNVQSYYKKYTKIRSGAQNALVHQQQALEEFHYLESVKTAINLANDRQALGEIKEELAGVGYIKQRTVQKKGRKQKEILPQPMKFLLSHGYTALVGKNNVQNDYVTLKVGRSPDLWLHVKDLPGSHVIVQHQDQNDYPPEVVGEAAQLAAWFSKARYSGQVPVDYTLKKNVHKPSGAKPGMVIYEHQKTLFITPEEEQILQLQQGAMEVPHEH